jgi:hypothetical protein
MVIGWLKMAEISIVRTEKRMSDDRLEKLKERKEK